MWRLVFLFSPVHASLGRTYSESHMLTKQECVFNRNATGIISVSVYHVYCLLFRYFEYIVTCEYIFCVTHICL